MMVNKITAPIKYTKTVFSIQPTGVFPIKVSRKVPPPMAVTKPIIKIPKISSLLSIAARAPEIAKATVPRIFSILKSDSSIWGAKVYFNIEWLLFLIGENIIILFIFLNRKYRLNPYYL